MAICQISRISGIRLASEVRLLAMLAFLVLTGAAVHVVAAELRLRLDRKNGIFSSGESATWSIDVANLKANERPPESVNYRLVSNSLVTLQRGEVMLSNGKGSLSAKRGTPGTLMVIVTAPGYKPISSGAVFDPRALKPSLPCPEDFNAFWSGNLESVKAVPLMPVLTPEVSPNPLVTLSQVTLDNVGGTKVHGQLAMPNGRDREKFPAMLIIQGLGFSPLSKLSAVKPASQGWLVLNVQAHDIPAYGSRESFSQIRKTTHRDFFKIGNEDRAKSYYLGMYLGTVQAVRYLQSRAEWNGTVLVVRGGSQAGMFALVAAALNSDVVTGVMAKVPGGCDLNGNIAGNRAGFPDWWNAALERPMPEKVRRTAEYYDLVNFAPMIKAPTLVGVALGDRICPPPGIFIVSNQLNSAHELLVMPSAGHDSTPLNPHRAFDDKEAGWLESLKQGETPSTAKQPSKKGRTR
ncbi:MAG: acetylxylan esterase [Opitutaceae bacterium]|nr:acetylxylan esterase [Opitutaceae bacterium]